MKRVVTRKRKHMGKEEKCEILIARTGMADYCSVPCLFPWLSNEYKVRKALLRLAMGLVRITSWYPNFNGSHFGLPPSEIHRMTRPPPKIVWTMTYSHRPHPNRNVTRNSNGKTVKQTAEKLARASICDVMVPHWCHLATMARSRDWIKITVISRNQPASSDDMMLTRRWLRSSSRSSSWRSPVTMVRT